MNTPEEDKQVEQATKVAQIALELTLRGGKRWIIGKWPHPGHFILESSDGHVLHLSFGGYQRQGRIMVSGGWPKYKTNVDAHSMDTVTPRDHMKADTKGPDYKEITVSDTKDGTAIGVDISRRFLPGYYKLWNLCKDIAVAYEKNAREAMETAVSLAQVVGGDRVKGNGIEATFWVSNAGNVRVTSYDGKQSVYLERILGLPVDVAAVVINAVSGVK